MRKLELITALSLKYKVNASCYYEIIDRKLILSFVKSDTRMRKERTN